MQKDEPEFHHLNTEHTCAHDIWESQTEKKLLQNCPKRETVTNKCEHPPHTSILHLSIFYFFLACSVIFLLPDCSGGPPAYS